ncbi:MAG: hypothetical protein ACNA77_04455 [Opitutales bacterium]
MFEELDYQQTARGELILRRRQVPMLQNLVVYEVILNGEFLHSTTPSPAANPTARFTWPNSK